MALVTGLFTSGIRVCNRSIASIPNGRIARSWEDSLAVVDLEEQQWQRRSKSQKLVVKAILG